MFCYQAAAFRKSAGLASVITMGSPVDLHRTRQARRGRHRAPRRRAARRAVVAARAHRGPARHVHVDRLQAAVARARRSMQLVDFVRNLHDRQALEKREAKRLFLGGEGFVAWPGPAFRKFVDELIVGNRMQSGGFVIDGHTVTLADSRARSSTSSAAATRWAGPAAVRGIRRAAPQRRRDVRGPAQGRSLRPRRRLDGADRHVAERRRVDALARGRRRPPQHAIRRPRDATRPIRSRDAEPTTTTTTTTTIDDDELDSSSRRTSSRRPRRPRSSGSRELSEDLGDYLDNARWQLPRLDTLRNLQDDSLISLGRSLAEQARDDRRPHVLPVPRPRVHLRRGQPPRRRGRARPDRVRHQARPEGRRDDDVAAEPPLGGHARSTGSARSRCCCRPRRPTTCCRARSSSARPTC